MIVLSWQYLKIVCWIIYHALQLGSVATFPAVQGLAWWEVKHAGQMDQQQLLFICQVVQGVLWSVCIRFAGLCKQHSETLTFLFHSSLFLDIHS